MIRNFLCLFLFVASAIVGACSSASTSTAPAGARADADAERRDARQSLRRRGDGHLHHPALSEERVPPRRRPAHPPSAGQEHGRVLPRGRPLLLRLGPEDAAGRAGDAAPERAPEGAASRDAVRSTRRRAGPATVGLHGPPAARRAGRIRLEKVDSGLPDERALAVLVRDRGRQRGRQRGHRFPAVADRRTPDAARLGRRRKGEVHPLAAHLHAGRQGQAGPRASTTAASPSPISTATVTPTSRRRRTTEVSPRSSATGRADSESFGRGFPKRDFSSQAVVLLDANRDKQLDIVASRDVVEDVKGQHVDKQQVRLYVNVAPRPLAVPRRAPRGLLLEQPSTPGTTTATA